MRTADHEEERVDLFGNVTIEKVAGKHSDGWGQTKNYSREWLDYARSSAQNIKNPMALCVSATQGDMAFRKD